MALAGFQLEVYGRLERALAFSDWTILSGRPGCGKHTVVEHLSQALGLKLQTISLAGRTKNIQVALLGHTEQGWLVPNETGLLSSGDSCIFLTDLEEAAPEVTSLLYLLGKSSLRSERGQEPSPLVILSIKDKLNPTQLSKIQPLLRFIPIVDFNKAISGSDIRDVIKLIAANLNTKDDFKEEDISFLEMPSDGFHSIKKWLIEASIESGCCSPEGLRRAIARSMLFYLERLVYRGNPISLGDYLRWVNQFNPRCRSIADRILCAMVDSRYIFDVNTLNHLLNQLVIMSGIPKGIGGVVFCNWQAFMKSSGYITWEIKERGAWGKRPRVIDMETPEDWKAILAGRPKFAILADDFVGTGGSISVVIPRLTALLDSYPSLQIRALFVAGFAEGIQQLKSLEKKYGSERFSVHVGRLFYGTDTCFSPDSQIIENPSERDLLSLECDRLSALGLGVHSRGFGGLGTLIVFPSNVPNTTLPLLWYDRSDAWIPLFPASIG